jgi:hypothetical protein
MRWKMRTAEARVKSNAAARNARLRSGIDRHAWLPLMAAHPMMASVPNGEWRRVGQQETACLLGLIHLV